MRINKIKPIRGYKIAHSIGRRASVIAPNTFKHAFRATHTNRAFVIEIPYSRARQDSSYLAAMVDLLGHKIVS